MGTVIFDTNSYRQFVLGKDNIELHVTISELLILEEKKGLRAYVTNVVGMELMANLAEGENGVNFSNCRDSLIAMSHHCYEKGTDLSRLIPPPLFHIANLVFGVLPINYNRQSRNISNLYNQFQLNNGLPANFFTKANFYEDLKNYALKTEENFAENIHNLINSARQNIIAQNPKLTDKIVRQKLVKYLQSNDFKLIFSIQILKDVAKELDLHPSDNQLIDMANYLSDKLPLTIGFFKWITTKLAKNDIDIKSKKSRGKRWNWIWDFQLTFLISEHAIDGGSVILVTSDSEIKAILNEFNFHNRVMTLQEYMTFIKE